MLPLLLGAGGAIGGATLGSRLAGRYAPELRKKVQSAAAKNQKKASEGLFRAAEYIPGRNMEAGGLGGLGLLARDVQKGLRGAGQQVAMLSTNPLGIAAQYAPATVGLGLGAMGGTALAEGLSGPEPLQVAIDPEMPGSSNILGSRMNMQQYPVMY